MTSHHNNSEQVQGLALSQIRTSDTLRASSREQRTARGRSGEPTAQPACAPGGRVKAEGTELAGPAGREAPCRSSLATPAPGRVTAHPARLTRALRKHRRKLAHWCAPARDSEARALEGLSPARGGKRRRMRGVGSRGPDAAGIPSRCRRLVGPRGRADEPLSELAICA